jgi:hypothetical protein
MAELKLRRYHPGAIRRVTARGSHPIPLAYGQRARAAAGYADDGLAQHDQ